MPHHHPAILGALGWTILNSWWQFGILWILVQVLKRMMPNASAALRYNLSLSVLLTGLGWSVIGFFLNWMGGVGSWVAWTVSDGSGWADGIKRLLQWVNVSLPYLAIVYLAWLAIQILRFTQNWWQSRQLVQDALVKAPVDWRLFLGRTAYQMHILQPVQLWLSSKIDSPLIFGWIKPVILLPVSALTQLSAEQIEAVLIHELAHIKRRDYFWNLIISFADILYYFNPFVSRLVAMIREEREHACDDWVLQFPYQPQTYAGALLLLEQQRSISRSQLLLAANGGTPALLLNRVQRMLQLPVSKQKSPGRFLLLTSILTVAIGLCFWEPQHQFPGLKGQVQPQPVARVAEPADISKIALPGSRVPLEGNPEKLEAVATEQSGKSRRAHDSQELARQELKVRANQEWQLTRVKAWTEEQEAASLEQASLALATEERNYSLAEPGLSKDPGVNQEGYPYIPKASFEAPLEPDTAFPVAELQSSLANLRAREAALQTQLALNQLNWEELNSRLKDKEQSAEALRVELEKSLAAIDWKKVQADADRAVKDMAKMTLSQKARITQQLRDAFWKQQLQIEKLQKELESRQKHLKQQSAAKGTIIYF